MKYVKKASIVRNDPITNRFAILENGRIVTTTKVAMEIPRGDDSTRPGLYVDGMVRYNADLTEAEMYNGQGAGLGWEVVRTVRPAPITVQTLGPGNYATFDFGPLQYSSGEFYTDFTHPQNIFVFIENVWQIPTTNYTLIQSGSRVYVRFNEAPPLLKYITVLLGYDGYFPPFPSP